MDNAPDTSSEEIQDVPLFSQPAPDVTDTPSTPVEETSNSTDAQDTPAPTETEANDSEATEPTTEQPPASEQSQPETQAPETTQPTPQEREQAARAAYLQRQRTRAEVAQQLDTEYGPRTEEDLLNEGLTPEQAAVQALREEMQYERERGRVAELNANLRAEAVEVISDFGVYNPDSPDYDAEFTTMVEQQYRVASRLQDNGNGVVLNAEQPLYDFYKNMAAIRDRAAQAGQKQGQANVQEMLARTENPGGTSTTSGQAPNSIEEFEARYGDMPIA